MHIAKVDIEFDPDKAASNLLKHMVTIEDPDAEGELRLVTLGMDSLGRVLVVVPTLRGTRVRLISARNTSRGESEHYYA
jgi:uncharacterized protein